MGKGGFINLPHPRFLRHFRASWLMVAAAAAAVFVDSLPLTRCPSSPPLLGNSESFPFLLEFDISWSLIPGGQRWVQSFTRSDSNSEGGGGDKMRASADEEAQRVLCPFVQFAVTRVSPLS